MRTFKYKTFTDAFYKLNRWILRNSEKLDYCTSTMSHLGNFCVETTSDSCEGIDLAKLGYGTGKWGHLIRSYLKEGKVDELRTLGTNVSGLSCGFDFSRKTEGNGACIRELILTRENRKGPWTGITIIWRTAELQKKWAADLILMNKIIEIIPNTNIQKFNLVFASAYQHTMYTVPLVDTVFGVDWKHIDPKVSSHARDLVKSKQNYFNIHEKKRTKRMLATGERMFEFYKKQKLGGYTPKPVTWKDVSLDEYH